MAILSPAAEEAGALGGDNLADGAEDSGESWLGGALRFAQAAEQEDAEQHRGLFDDEADAVGGAAATVCCTITPRRGSPATR